MMILFILRCYLENYSSVINGVRKVPSSANSTFQNDDDYGGLSVSEEFSVKMNREGKKKKY